VAQIDEFGQILTKFFRRSCPNLSLSWWFWMFLVRHFTIFHRVDSIGKLAATNFQIWSPKLAKLELEGTYNCQFPISESDMPSDSAHQIVWASFQKFFGHSGAKIDQKIFDPMNPLISVGLTGVLPLSRLRFSKTPNPEPPNPQTPNPQTPNPKPPLKKLHLILNFTF